MLSHITIKDGIKVYDFNRCSRCGELTRVISFWGKGGVGKTTCSSSAAVWLSSRGLKVLLVSSDQAPSLSDILGVNLSSEPRAVGDLPLWAAEIDEDSVIRLWKERFGDEVYEVVSSFIPVDREIIDYIAGAPGIGFQFMLWYILSRRDSGEYDYIIWDTAPAGGSLSLLKIEHQLYTHLGDAARLYMKVKSTLERIRRKSRDPLTLISHWRTLAEDVLRMLSSENFKCYIVAIPEWLGYSQTVRIVDELRRFKIRIGGIIVNQVFDPDKCSCKSWIRRASIHSRYVEMFKKRFGSTLPVKTIPVQPVEIKGLDTLLDFADNIKDIL